AAPALVHSIIMDQKQPDKQKSSSCPNCNSSEHVVSIVYGKPNHQLMEKAKSGAVKLGGCCVSPNCPTKHCEACKFDFRP
ncbi:hypothetical protein BOX15_Mlig010596g1, partial [Macrostomum lignano]